MCDSTLGGKHQLIYRIRARSLRPNPHVVWIRYEPEIEWTLNPDIFFIWWRNKIEPSSLPTTISTPELFSAWRTGVEIVPTKAEQDTNFACFTTHALFSIFLEESWVLEWILLAYTYMQYHFSGVVDLPAPSANKKGA